MPDAARTKADPELAEAEDLHKIMLMSRGIEHKARRAFIKALLVMKERELYKLLGCSSLNQYVCTYFKDHRTLAFDFLGVAKALRYLPLCDEAYRTIGINWSQLQAITKIATTASEATWIEFAQTHSYRHLKAEVKKALEDGRDDPRGDGYGLPNVDARRVFTMSIEEEVTLTTGLAAAANELVEDGDYESVSSTEALLHIVRKYIRIRRGEEKDTDSSKSPYTIVYTCCTDCGRAALPTPDGPIEVPDELIKRLEEEAEKVTLPLEEQLPDPTEVYSSSDATEEPPREVPPEERDRPNTETDRRKVRLKDGKLCGNPYCGRRIGLHAHHITFRCHGGKTALSNEVAICPTCHTLIHHGLLTVTGTPLTGLTWAPRLNNLDVELEKEVLELCAFPDLTIQVTADDLSGRPDTFSPNPEPGEELPKEAEAYVNCLVGLGCKKKDAEWRIAEAYKRLRKDSSEPKEEDILHEALRC